MFIKTRLCLATCVLSIAACAQGTNTIDMSQDGAGAAAAGTAGSGGTPGEEEGGWVSGSWDGAECGEATQFIYVITTGSQLFRFWPPTASFEYVGNIDCPVTMGDWTPLSMSIDRMGQAWILYWDQVVYRLDLGTGKCLDSGYNPQHEIPGPFGYFGMAFTADSASPQGESLFLRQVVFYENGSDPGTRSLGRFDTTNFTVTPIGDGLGGNADLAGTGDGRLFGFEKIPSDSGDGQGQLAEYDPTSGARIAVTPLNGLMVGDTWAVAAWGGDIWLFTSLYGESTRVVRYQPSSGALDVVVPSAKIRVIGAGVSSCAPISPPK